MSNADSELVVSEDEAYELLAHLLASAEICTFEPTYYGPFRLLDAASRLMESMLKHSTSGDTSWLENFKREVDQKKGWMMWDRPGYFQFLNEVAGEVAAELKRRDADRETSTQST
jgi:Family of unknown function (DUF6092)